MGWEPTETTVYEYDGDRLVRSTVTKSPEWDAEQLSLMLAWEKLRADIGHHGHLLSEARDPANEGKYVVEAGTDYVDKAEAQFREQRKKEFPDDPQHGVFFDVRKRD